MGNLFDRRAAEIGDRGHHFLVDGSDAVFGRRHPDFAFLAAIAPAAAATTPPPSPLTVAIAVAVSLAGGGMGRALRRNDFFFIGFAGFVVFARRGRLDDPTDGFRVGPREPPRDHPLLPRHAVPAPPAPAGPSAPAASPPP